MLALFINAAILIVAALTFHEAGYTNVTKISEAFRLLSPLLGISVASTLFALALLGGMRLLRAPRPLIDNPRRRRHSRKALNYR
jgi:TRAP-type C4-dicarboxylate transport system permease small subunit